MRSGKRVGRDYPPFPIEKSQWQRSNRERAGEKQEKLLELFHLGYPTATRLDSTCADWADHPRLDGPFGTSYA